MLFVDVVCCMFSVPVPACRLLLLPVVVAACYGLLFWYVGYVCSMRIKLRPALLFCGVALCGCLLVVVVCWCLVFLLLHPVVPDVAYCCCNL